MAGDVAPSHNAVSFRRHDMRVSLLNHIQNEIACLRKRERFKHGQVFSLPRDNVESRMETLNVLCGCIGDFNHTSSKVLRFPKVFVEDCLIRKRPASKTPVAQ